MKVHGSTLRALATVDLMFRPGEVVIGVRQDKTRKIQVLAAIVTFQQSALREPCVGDIRVQGAGHYILRDGSLSKGRWRNDNMRLDDFPAEVQDLAITEIEKALSSLAPITTLDRTVTR